ncbi:hypothetical protein EC973_003124 [Apophysomyces ossiformis]|uniref:Methyltransferase type 11 domain-containing protein n=1 Tax=Apophysomyces ossiformis TaxID=679940 RepID=A0A8H7BHJ2_9FUNG|nr:hypothetical protein EC973_003124 [Apophysomyces ossiformis]
MAQLFPYCKVTGIDFALPNEHDQFNGIPNLQFMHGDIRLPLAFADHTFDLIYQRDVASMLPSSCWPQLISEWKRILKPGGYLQLTEYDPFFKNPGPVLSLINEWCKLAALTLGVDPYGIDKLPHLLRSVGFECQVHSIDIPIGEWPKDPSK